MMTLVAIIACGGAPPSPCVDAESCRIAADEAAGSGDRASELVAVSTGCDLYHDDALCMRLGALLLDKADSAHYSPATGRAYLGASCRNGHLPACPQAGDNYAAADDLLSAGASYHRGCELGDLTLCIRSATFAVEVQKRDVGLTALPDAVRACERGDVPTCHAAITIAMGVGPPPGQTLDAFTRSVLDLACAAGDTNSCAPHSK